MPTDLLMAMDIDVDTMERGLLMLKLLLMHLMAKGLLSLMGSLVTFMVLVLELPDILAMLPAMSEELFLAIHLIIMARGLLKPRLRLMLTMVDMVMEEVMVDMPTDLLMAMDIDVDTMERGLLMLKLLLMHLMAKGLLSLMGSLVTFMVLVLELLDILAMLPAMWEEPFLAIHLIIMARG